MTDLDIEMVAISLLRDAKLLSCTPRHALARHAKLLRETQEELTLAVLRVDELVTA